MRESGILDSLLADGAIDKDKYAIAKSIVRQTKKSEIYALSASGFICDAAVSKAVSKKYALEYVSLKEARIDKELLTGLSADILFSLSAVPFSFTEDRSGIKVAFADPSEVRVVDDISAYTGRMVIPYISSIAEVNSAIEHVYRNTATSLPSGTQTASRGADSDGDAVSFVDEILVNAVRRRASDVHIEGIGGEMRVRYRIDGELFECFRRPIGLLDGVTARIKILGNLDIAERRVPQDGKYSAVIDSADYDIRISVIPTIFGEKSVLRIAPKRLIFNSKKDLGLLEDDVQKFDRLFSSSHGMVLLTGPTGCGKTTTLYSALSELNSVSRNIITVEDPIEVTIPGINQIQLSRPAGLTFSSVLRSILRQDPNIIMIGEIRDAETAKLAVQSSITGHLVLSTLHTNSAASAVNRLVNMGVERYLLSDAVKGIISQRLVRRLCPDCREEYTASDAECESLNIEKGTRLFRPRGCENCSHTGYVGRTSVFEILEINDEMRDIINEDYFETEKLQRCAVESGMRTLMESASLLARRGITSFDEILKIYSD